MERNFNRKLVLEDGSEYYGYAFGAKADKVLELVFNTSMVGYQEVISDLTYANQMIVMTYPIIGSYGIIDEDMETKAPVAGGLVVRDYNDNPSNFRYTKTLSEILEENNIPGIYGLDTRKLTRNLRDTGTKKAYITDVNVTKEEALEILDSLLSESYLSKDVKDKMVEWISYKAEIKDFYTETGLKALLRKVYDRCKTYGDTAVMEVIDDEDDFTVEHLLLLKKRFLIRRILRIAWKR